MELAQIFEGAAIPFEHFTDHIDRADIVISSTGAPHFIIGKNLAEQIMHRRKNKPMFFIDIAVPRDIDPTVNEIDNAFLYDIDDLQQVIDENLKERMKEASKAEEIVASEVQAFCLKMKSREVVPTIVQLRDTLDKVRRDDIERTPGEIMHQIAAHHYQARECRARVAVDRAEVAAKVNGAVGRDRESVHRAIDDRGRP